MDVIKLVGIGLIILVLSILLREYKKEYAIYVSLVGGIIILLSCLGTMQDIIDFINKISVGTSYNQELIRTTFKNYRSFNSSTVCCNTLYRLW